MRARVWGCRGSIASPGPEMVRYGGNTSCVELQPSDGRTLIVDAGTGMRNLGQSLTERNGRAHGRIDILLSHLHLDHIEGLGFFDPLWVDDVDVHVWGPRPGESTSLLDGLRAYFGPPIFPIPIHEVPANLAVHELGEGPFELGPLRITAARIEHPGPTFGYRIEDGDAVLTYISDHEPTATADLDAAAEGGAPDGLSGAALARDAGVLLHDAQYTEAEYPRRVGWGHSSVAHAVAFARLTRARRLLLFHHDPAHTDEDLDAMLARARELWGADPDLVQAAAEGMELEIGRRRPADPPRAADGGFS